MRASFIIRSVLSSALSLAAVALAWLYLAPPALHGSTNYVVIRGVSMQPRFHAGDLAVVRSGGSYRIGDIVAYRSSFLNTLILHRIVGIEGGRYLFKGDNNNFIDSERPTRSQLAGELWVRVPEAGRVFAWMGRPSHAALVAGLSALFALAGGGLGVRSRRRRTERPTVRGGRPRRSASPYTPELAGTLLALGLIAALVFGVLALVGYRHRTTMTVEQPAAYVEHGTYGYSAVTQPSAIYPNGTVSSGDTVFVRLVHRLGLSFHYRFASSLPHAVAGDAQLSAALVSGAGWTRQVGVARRRFKGDDVRLAVHLDLASVEKMIAGYYRIAGVPTDTFDVVVTPRVETRGVVAGRAVTSSFVPASLDFTLGPDVLRAAGAATGATGGHGEALFQRSRTGTLARAEPGTVQLLGRSFGVKTLREVGSIGGLGALLLVLLAAAALVAARRGGELLRIQRTYGSALVAVSSPPQTPEGRYVDVPTFDSLVQLAETYEKLILHHQQWGVHSFYIDDDSSVYRYTLDRSPQGREAQPSTEVV